MKITILTLFPEFFDGQLQSSILKRAQEKQLVEIKLVNIRDFATDKHSVTDDTTYGGGPGMIMKVEPIDRALQSLELSQNKRIVLTSAKGKLYKQATAKNYAKLDDLVIICGHYGGVDERVAKYLVDEEIRIGDYVLTGGEPAAAVITDSVTRLMPGVLGNQESLENESHGEEFEFSYPLYTHPADYKGWQVPEVLLSGNHAKIREWQKKHAQSRR